MKNSKIYPWVVVALLWVVALLNYLDRQMLSTMQPSMKIDIQELQSAENFGILMAIFLLIYGFMSPIAGIIADKFNRKWIIVGSLFVWSLVTYLMGHAETFTQLKWLRALMGISEGLYIPAGLSLIADYHSDRTRSLAIGIHMTGLYMGQALGGFGATVASQFSWQLTFHYFGIVGVIYAIILVFLLRDKKVMMPAETIIKKDVANNRGKDIKAILGNVSFWILLFYFAVPSLPGWATKNWLPTLFSQNLNIDMATAGPISTITIAFSSLIGVIAGGIISDKWVQKNIKGRVYVSAIGLFLTIPAIILLGFGHSLFAVIGSAFCFGIGYGMWDANNMPILTQIVPANLRGTAYGIMNMVGVFFGYFITQYLGKSTDSGSLGKDFAMLAIIVAIALILQLIFIKPKSKIEHVR